MSLEKNHPEIFKEFYNGNFVVHKYNREFAGLSIDQAHKQSNACIKGNEGATEN